jgi:hypothetical protein
MTGVDYSRLGAVALSFGIALHSAWMLFDEQYCVTIIHRTYRQSDQHTEETRLRNARIAAAVVLLVSTYYGFRFIFIW